jgi:GT2 family glycosyltransferase
VAATSSRPTVVVLGMMTKMPVAGVVWQTMHYVLGFARLGCDVYYVETHARAPSMLMEREEDDGAARAAEFISATMGRFGLGDRWAYVALHDDGRCYGLSHRELRRVYGSAAAIFNLHGGTEPLPEFAETGRLVYLETDPVQLQLELAGGLQRTVDFLEPHVAFFTFAENLGAADCSLPVPASPEFRPTRQPVVMDLWRVDDDGALPTETFTTVGNWRQSWRDVKFGGTTYTWSKHHEFLKYLDLPRRTGRPFELALSSYEPADRELLETHGWGVRSGLEISDDPEVYRRYIGSSHGEFTVAKDQNVRLRTGWFSDRSATYLACGKPVVTQETGFSNVLPTGQGLFGYSDLEEAVSAVESVEADYGRHARAALELAREHFSHEVVLSRLLGELGVCCRGGWSRSLPVASPFPGDMVLSPISRRPIELPASTIDVVLASPVGTAVPVAAPPRPRVTIVVVSFDNLVFTRMCLESVLAHTSEPAYDLVVVDNGSRDGSRGYLLGLAEHDRRVRLVLNAANAGFPAACNQGIAASTGDVVVLLNNDTMVPPGWLPRLIRHLDEESVGLVGPVTNRIGNEAEVAADYRTWGQFLHAAGERALRQRHESFEIDTLTMFCVALRRELYRRVGPLDAGFGIGTLEDDDYSLRVRKAGYRLLCAVDVLVHHFGEASFGKLFRDGERERVLEANRARFERKWGVPWQPYAKRPAPEYLALTERVRMLVGAHTPSDATVLVVSRGDERLVAYETQPAWHFPRDPSGAWAGYHPADSDDAVRQLEDLVSQGAEYLVVPKTAFWWLEFYGGFARHLDEEYSLVLREDDCLVFDLGPRNARERAMDADARVPVGAGSDAR